MITTNDVWGAIGTTIRRFRWTPEFFFTEADLVAYLYHTLYHKDQPIGRTDCPPSAKCVHLEYPTCFRYFKRDLNEERDPHDDRGSRGHYDVVVLDPEFVRTTPFQVVINKNNAVSHAHDESLANTTVMPDERFEGAVALCPPGTTVPTGQGLRFAIEFKYVINNSQSFVTQVRQDNCKLHWAKQKGAAHVVNLVFCNTTPCTLDALTRVVLSAPSDVTCLFIQSFRDDTCQRKAPVVLTNCQDPCIRALLGI